MRGPPAGTGADEPNDPSKALPRARRGGSQARWSRSKSHNAAVLHEGGVPFAFSTQGQTGDKPWEKFRDNLRKAIADGLSPDAALLP